MTIVHIAIAAVIVVGALAAFFPAVRNTLKIWVGIGTRNATTPAQRAEQRQRDAEAKIPALRENVAKQMTAAENAAEALAAKKREADSLLTQYQTAKSANASAQTQETIKLRWTTANGAIAGLEQAAKDAHDEAETAQKELEDTLQVIAESAAGVEKLKNDASLAQVYRDSAKLRTQLNDLKKGLGDSGEDAKAVRDELKTAKNANELSKGSTADREMAEIERKAKLQSADADIEAALAARNGNK